MASPQNMTFSKWLCEASGVILGLLVAMVALCGLIYSVFAATALPALNTPASIAVTLGGVAGTVGVPPMAVWVKKEVSATLAYLFAHIPC